MSPSARRQAGACCIVIIAAFATLDAQSSVSELNDAGWKALQSGYGDRAATLFRQALAMQPNDPVLLLGAGAAAEARGEPREAMTQLQRALKIEPRLTAAARLLGQIAYHEGESDLAMQTYEAALKYAPGDSALQSELDAWRHDADLHRQFEERRLERFRVMFEGRAVESLAAEATQVLNSAFWRIGEKLGEYPPNTIVAVLYTEQQFRDITRAPEWSGGVYDGRIRIPVAGASADPAQFEHVLTHELTHAIIAGIAPRGVPAWLHEGLAQYFEGADPQAARRRVQAQNRQIPIASLDRTFSQLDAADVQLAYDESLLAVGAMLDRPGFGWERLLHSFGGDESLDRILGGFGFSYADLEARFK